MPQTQKLKTQKEEDYFQVDIRVLVVSSICQFVTLESIFWRKRIKDMQSVGNKIENIPNMAF